MKKLLALKASPIWIAFLLFSFSPVLVSAQGDCTQTGLTNGGFEYGQAVNGFNFYSESSGGWTSQNYSIVEIWGTGFGGIVAYQGTNFMELNSSGPDVVYQDINTAPGESYNWQVVHRGRLGVDVANLEYGPPGGPYTLIQSMSDGTAAWGLYTGTYTIPSGQTSTRIRLVSISFAGGCPSCANFIDAFSFQAVDTDGDGVADCIDGCPLDADKIAPGQCGCGVADTDSDGDNIANCNDNCISTENPSQDDSDCDGRGNACDVCPGGNDMVDNDNNGLPDCHNLPDYSQIIEAWKCGNNKVLMAHRTGNGGCNTICISYNAAQAHLNHGDYLGPCNGASCNQNFSIPDVYVSPISSEELEVYPNPATDEVNIQLHGLNSAKVINLYDNLGRAIWSGRLTEGQDRFRLDISSARFTNGTYFVQVTSDQKIAVRRFNIIK